MKRNQQRILAIDPTTKGFGYAVYEGPERLVDWGLAYIGKAQNEACLRRTEELLDRYTPDVLVLEDTEGVGSRRCMRVDELIRQMRATAWKRNIKTRSIAPQTVRDVFAEVEATNKDEIAAEIGARHPELAPRVPPPRRIWEAEHHHMGMFDAAALALTFFALKAKRRSSRRARTRAAA